MVLVPMTHHIRRLGVMTFLGQLTRSSEAAARAAERRLRASEREATATLISRLHLPLQNDKKKEEGALSPP